MITQTHDFHDIEYVVGIDSGGTKSAIHVWKLPARAEFEASSLSEHSDELPQPELICEFRQAGLNLDLLSASIAEARLDRILQELSAQAQLSRTQLTQRTVLVMGMAGLDTPLDQSEAEDWLTDQLKSRGLGTWKRYVISDVELGLWAARPDGVGVVLIAGTGSNCFGRDAQGTIAKAGGLSHFFSDEGSGFMLGWKAFHIMGKMYDGRLEKTTLYDAVLQTYKVDDFAQLKQLVVRDKDFKQVVAQAAPVVQDQWQAGDLHATILVEEAIQDLSAMVQTVQSQLQGEPPVSLVGSLFKDAAYRQSLEDHIHTKHSESLQTQHVPDPVIGALAFWQHIDPNNQQ